jgi:hypothetical protein
LIKTFGILWAVAFGTDFCFHGRALRTFPQGFGGLRAEDEL